MTANTQRLYTDLAWLWPLWGDVHEDYAHLHPGGVMVVTPDVTTERFVQNRTATTTVSRDGLDVVFVENVYDPDPSDEHYETTIV